MVKEELYDALSRIATESEDILYNFPTHINISEFEFEENTGLFELLRKISSLGEQFEKGEPQFFPMVVLADGRTSFSVDDMTDEDFNILSELELARLPVKLAIRVADLLWFKKKDILSARFSIRNYYSLYLSTFDYDDWVECVENIKRAVTLSQKLNDNVNRTAYLKDIFERLIKNEGKDKNYFSVTVADFLIEQGWNDLDPILSVMNNIISTQFDIRKSERAFEIKRKIYVKQKNNELVHAADCEHAEYLERVADNCCNNDFQGLIQAEQCLCKAVILYRNGNDKNAADAAHQKLLNVQSRLPKEMEMAYTTFNVADYYNNTKEVLEGLTFEEHILFIASICQFFSKEEIKKSVYDPDFFFSKRLFGTKIADKQGRTIKTIPALNDNSSAAVEEEHMYFDAVKKEQIYGNTVLKWAVQFLNERFHYSENDIEFIIKDNWIIPKGRERIFMQALYLGLKGDLYLSLHLLAPQVENLFRNIASLLGNNMSTLNSQGIAEDKLLSSIFDDNMLNECYEENILFTFKGLMNEKAGGNLRNRIAHGIIDEDECSGDVALYFLCATIKLLLLTSYPAYKIKYGFLKKHQDSDNKKSENPEI